MIHSFHLIDMPALVSVRTLMRPPDRTTVEGLQHAECLVTMRFAAPSDVPAPHVHQVAMAEQRRRDFHHQSTFMRFRPLSEHGVWQGRHLLPGGLRRRSTS